MARFKFLLKCFRFLQFNQGCLFQLTGLVVKNT